ncbi:MAG: MaoC/PaaZ C-terminal domain-containing protein [Alphaproteobacteria bacterium]|jgi:itaconyl-CoA hydratase
MVDFKNYIKINNNRYREQYGLDFEQFTVGQKFLHRPGLTISQQDNKEEALDTINNAQLHYDAHYASQTEWKNNLGVSTLTIQKLIGMTWKTFGKKYRILAYDDISMTHPVFGGDTLYSTTEIIKTDNYIEDPNLGVLTLVTSGINQRQEVVSTITYQILVYKKGRHPLEIDSTPVTDKKFNSHRQLADGSFMEESGLYYEDLEVGEIYEHRPARTFSAEENRIHAMRSLDWHPQYTDANYAKKFLGDKVPVNQTFLIGTITALTTRTFDRVVANLQWRNIKLLLEVFVGDTVCTESSIISKRESKSRPTQGILEATTNAYNQEGKLVCSFERHFLIYKKGVGPYETVGY